jgi:hypothetical protein
MIIQLQFSEIMGCANLFQRFLTLAVYCVATPKERNKKCFFLNSEGNPRQYLKKNIGDIKT